MKVDMTNGSSVDLDDAVFARDFNEALVHQAVVAYQAGSRSGTKAQKSRSDVSGGGAKPWRQKGTGRARAGTSRGPIWRKGGVTFAARPRNYSQKMNKKMYRAAMRSIFSELVRQERFVVVEGFNIDKPNTKAMVAFLHSVNADKGALLVTTENNINVNLSSRNIPYCQSSSVFGLNPLSLVSHDKVVVTSEALDKIQEWLA
ncbi:MAG TPA: 50S ribosomal protein L4 [Gammaproteobacteria bacterium]|nr:50S ribosomal protein L4 [Gammaproteobacteria bacterium]